MAELVDAHDSKSCGAIRESSILSLGTTSSSTLLVLFVLCRKYDKILILKNVNQIMNFYTIFTVGYTIVSVILIYLIYRDQRRETLFFGKHKKLAWIIINTLAITSFLGLYVRFVEPFTILTKETKIVIKEIKQPIKIAFIADPQLNRFKNDSWAEKIDTKTIEAQPDIVIFGGDLVSNGGYFYEASSPNTSSGTEADWLNIFSKITEKYPSYYVLGNHEYGLGNTNLKNPDHWTGDQSKPVISVMEKIGTTSLNNHLFCFEIKNEKLCLFGIDDIWGAKVNLTKIDFSELKNWNQKTPLIFITHNPDGILQWPKDIKKPDLVLTGHTHGGQIYLPFIGPLGNAGIELGKQYYRGLNYYEGIPIYTSIGLGESGGPVRFMSAPELTVITMVSSD